MVMHILITTIKNPWIVALEKMMEKKFGPDK